MFRHFALAGICCGKDSRSALERPSALERLPVWHWLSRVLPPPRPPTPTPCVSSRLVPFYHLVTSVSLLQPDVFFLFLPVLRHWLSRVPPPPPPPTPTPTPCLSSRLLLPCHFVWLLCFLFCLLIFFHVICFSFPLTPTQTVLVQQRRRRPRGGGRFHGVQRRLRGRHL